MHPCSLLTGALALTLGSAALHGAVIVDPDAAPEGSNITSAYPGVTLRELLAGNLVDSVWSVTASASTGTRVFGRSFGAAIFGDWGGLVNRGMRVSFAQPVSWVSIDFIGMPSGGGASAGAGSLIAYDSGGQVLDAYLSAALSPGSKDLDASVSTSVPLISYVVATSAAPAGATLNADYRIGLDRLEYVIPEPASVMLAAIGVLMLLPRDRGRARAV